MFSLNDRTRLDATAFDHLRSQFRELRSVTLYVDPDRTLHIICTNRVQHEAVRKRIGAIERQAYLALGCNQVLTWETIADLQLALQSVEDDPMPSATIEKPASKTSTPSLSTSERLPGQAIANIAADVEQPIEAVKEWFTGKGITPIPFGNDEIVSGEDAIGCYAHFEPMVIQSRMARRGLSLPSAEQNGNGDGATATATATKPAAKSTAKTQATKTAAAKKRTAAKKPATRTKKSGGS